jgi:hypothetical protein
MRHQWRCSRSFQEQADGQRRWDQAYLLLVRWSSVAQPDRDPPVVDPTVPAGNDEEVAHASSDLRAGLDPKPGK